MKDDRTFVEVCQELHDNLAILAELTILPLVRWVLDLFLPKP